MTRPGTIGETKAADGVRQQPVPAAPPADTAERMETIRAEMAAAVEAAAIRVGRRLDRRYDEVLAASRQRARALLDHSREAARPGAREAGHRDERAPAPWPVADLHTLERLLSHVRHSVVRVCFYNLKLFCPSLVDEFDAYVKAQVVANIDQLGAVQAEIDTFFAQPLLEGQPVATRFPRARQRIQEHLGALSVLSRTVRDRLNEESVRRRLAERAPAAIDAVMDTLQTIQNDLDAHRVCVGDAIEAAAGLHQAMMAEQGMRIALEVKPAPRIFGDAHLLQDAFGELIANAATHSGGSTLKICAGPTEGRQFVEISFRDDGRGMSVEERRTCLRRGVSRSGTGEGLPMVVAIVEGQHLGVFEIAAKEQQGCRAVIRLPVKFNASRGDS